MRYNKTTVITFSLLFLGILLISVFNIGKADNQAAEVPGREAVKMGSVCLLGEKADSFPFYVYKDGASSKNKFFPTGIMGDFSSSGIDNYCKESPYAGPTCIKIIYKKKPGRIYRWAGLYWQYPPNNWGNISKGYDLEGATKLTFWARGKYGREIINKFQVGGIAGEYRDSGIASIGPVTLSKQWKKYTIDLRSMDNSIIVSNEDKECWPFMEPLSRIIGGFCWATSLKDNDGITFYLDEIRFEND
ncbi:hypothetical protein EPN54_00800 [bacterium]|nr:MAG: hypothetical protein EPN54_00800 [bacterium]